MFYIKTPTGQISFHIIEKCVLDRLEYLQLLYEGKPHEFNGDFEYLLENSVYDKIGHFILRLLTSVSQEICNYWVIRETLLFQTRLNYILPRQLYRLFKSILYQLGELKDKKGLINRTLIDICNFFSKPLVFKHIVSKNHTEDCDFLKIKVRHEAIPDLIKKRKLDLSAGYAIVYCSNWKKILTSLFYTYISNEVICMKSKAQYIINQDIRLNYLYYKIHSKILQENQISIKYGHITKKNIDIEIKNFPLCMQHLHTKLRTTHRLSHYARFYYSLFLKDGGMKLEDAINYWKEEYSKPHSCSSNCLHNWKSNERKFIYSIRHLYGLEGSRKNYKSPTCELICMNTSNPMYEGGCPFKSFDVNTLKDLLSLSLSSDCVTNLLKTTCSQTPQISCAKYFRMLNQNNSNNIVINSPLQYYFTMINQI
ncbi:probable DNA primase large subunit isoform X1 [Bombus impatiens]|uniref:Probable DNA primase large subunit isoform X1 n=1 Tax=Bombus impatiens TaxID=132113 RepID=A0A6P3UP42_BOMIM|nr:probable DNA primase large subunit isoform X1 [Bombus impatiens]